MGKRIMTRLADFIPLPSYPPIPLVLDFLSLRACVFTPLRLILRELERSTKLCLE